MLLFNISVLSCYVVFLFRNFTDAALALVPGGPPLLKNISIFLFPAVGSFPYIVVSFLYLQFCHFTYMLI